MKTKLLPIVAIALGSWSICDQGAVAATMQVVRTIDFPSDFSGLVGTDLAWDGEHLWTTMWSTLPPTFPYVAVVELDPSDGSLVSSTPIRVEGRLYHGHAWDGTYVWVTRFNPGTGDAGEPVPDSFFPLYVEIPGGEHPPGPYPLPYSPDAESRGAAWDGTSFWLSDSKHKMITQVDPGNGAIVTSFALPGTEPRGLAWDGNYLWSVDGVDDVIYQMDTSGNLLETWTVPLTDPYGITFDGEYLWVLDNDAQKVFQLAIPEPSTVVLLGMGAVSLLAVNLKKSSPLPLISLKEMER